MLLKRIGILDFGYRPGINRSSEEIYYLIKEAITLEKLRFSRIWYAEHICASGTIWSYPDMLIPIVAAYTKNINVGIAGTSVRYNNPIKVANDYQFLSRAFPDRVDLGFSKGVSLEYEQLLSKTNTSLSINALSSADLNMNIAQIISIISQTSSKPLNFWYLTNSAKGYLEALKLGINCCRSAMHLQSDSIPQLNLQEQYNEGFGEEMGKYPKNILCVSGTIQNNRKLIEQIKEKQRGVIDIEKSLCGNIEYVRKMLLDYASQYNVEEILFYEMSFNPNDRKRSFKRLSSIIDELSQK